MRLPASRPLIALILSALAVVTILLRWVTYPAEGGGRNDPDDLDLGDLLSVSSGGDLGLYLGLTAAAVAMIASIPMLRAARNSGPGQGVRPIA